MLHPWSCHYSQYLVLEILLLCKIEVVFHPAGGGVGLGGGQSLVVCGDCVGMVLAGGGVGMVVATCGRACG